LGHKVVSIDVENDSILNIKASAISEQQELELRNEIRDKLGVNMEILKFETVGPTIGAETLKKTVYAILLAILVIILYIAYAFKNVNYAISAVIALFHDILVVVGSYSIISHIFEAEFDLLFVTAILTTLAFSVHDTIVVFDQMRGYKKSAKFAGLSVEEQANHAVTSTIVRSLNNSLTIIFMLIALVLLGGESIRFFAVALLLGTVTGTYSSPFVSVPIAVFLEKRAKK
jgi:preprotein translocase subunit SecF